MSNELTARVSAGEVIVCINSYDNMCWFMGKAGHMGNVVKEIIDPTFLYMKIIGHDGIVFKTTIMTCYEWADREADKERLKRLGLVERPAMRIALD